jgi:alkylation response protein AidB-like acyl-CoA dehydrogenase
VYDGLNDTEYERLAEGVRAAIWDELAPLESRIEDEEQIPYDIVLPVLRKCGAFGLLVPREYGGRGLSIRQYLPLIAEFAKIQGGIRVVVHVHNSFAHALSEVGDDAQRKAILPGAATGAKSVAFALTEPEHGTGADLGTTARPSGSGYVLTGQKWLITNSDLASHFFVFAKTGPREVSAFLVERDAPGLSIEPLPETMGCKGGEHGLVTLDGVTVDSSALVGKPGEGQQHLERALEISRVFIAASSLGTSERALELSLAHA